MVSPVFQTDPGWQPAQIFSWWWCICWSETLSPAPVSGGLCTLPCISPSFLFYLCGKKTQTAATWGRKSLRLSLYFFYLNLRGQHAGGRTGSFPQSRLHARTGFICGLHLYSQHLKSTSLWRLYRYANEAVWSRLDDNFSKWISNSHEPSSVFETQRFTWFLSA